MHKEYFSPSYVVIDAAIMMCVGKIGDIEYVVVEAYRAKTRMVCDAIKRFFAPLHHNFVNLSTTQALSLGRHC